MRRLIYGFLAIIVLFVANMVLASDSYTAKYYQIYLAKKDGKIIQVNLGIKRGIKEPNTVTGEAIASLYSFSGEKLVATNFSLPKGDEQVILEVPYYNNGSEVKIVSNTGENLLTVKVAIFADTCPDEKCDGHESFSSCPEDCPSGSADGFCDKQKDGRCDSDCKPVNIDPDYPNCEAEKQASNIDSNAGQNQNKVNISEKNIAQNLMSDSADKGQKFSLDIKMIIGIVVVILLAIIFFVVKGMKKEEM